MTIILISIAINSHTHIRTYVYIYYIYIFVDMSEDKSSEVSMFTHGVCLYFGAWTSAHESLEIALHSADSKRCDRCSAR